VKPFDESLDVNHLPDGDYPVGFDSGDVASLASGVFMNGVHVYTMDLYAAADIEALAEGDTVVVEGENIAVRTVERDDDMVRVNGGLGAENGCDFKRVEDGGYRVNGYDDLATYTELGVTTLVVDESAVFQDSSDIGGEPVTAEYEGIVSAMQSAPISGFYPDGTTVTLQSGKVVKIVRVYTP
jgi:hypothetical protein